MKTVSFPYGREKLTYDFTNENLVGVLTSSIEDYQPTGTPEQLVREALDHPIGSPKLSELAKGKKNIVIIASDHTRPVPSKVILPPMLSDIRSVSPDADITILIATGCHRGTTKEELIGKFGEDIVKNEKIYIHDCDDTTHLRSVGTLPSGGDCEVNTLALDADLLIAEGFIEPHLFAGFSGGRKSILPGIASRKTVMYNHNSEFLSDPHARTGILQDNPVHTDMVWAAKAAKLTFIVNVVLNSEKQPIYAVTGDVIEAHNAGTEFLSKYCGVKAIPADIAITTNGGYPLDQNVYQAAKGMTAGEATVKEGGVVIMIAATSDGTGSDHFYHELADRPTEEAMQAMLARGRDETVPDQWQAQVILRTQLRATVIYLSEMEDEMVESMHMIPAHSLEEALAKAKSITGPHPSIVAIPEGISVMVR